MRCIFMAAVPPEPKAWNLSHRACTVREVRKLVLSHQFYPYGIQTYPHPGILQKESVSA